VLRQHEGGFLVDQLAGSASFTEGFDRGLDAPRNQELIEARRQKLARRFWLVVPMPAHRITPPLVA
jgi:hypothetical protein